jgi:hypothetical protein
MKNALLFSKRKGPKMQEIEQGLIKATSEATQAITTIAPHPSIIDANKTIDTWIGEMDYDDLFNDDQRGYYWVSRDVGGGKIAALLGIRAAELIASAWGGLQVDTRIIGHDARQTISRITIIDSASSPPATRSEEIATLHHYRASKEKGGGLVLWDEGGLSNKIKADQAKSIRNCILFLIPPPIKKHVEKTIRARMLQLQNDRMKKPEKRKADIDILEREFAKFDIEKADLETFIGGPLDSIDSENWIKLRGIWKALQSGEASAKDVLDFLHQKNE